MFLQRCSNTFVASMRYLASVTYVTDRRSQWKLIVDSHTGWAWERQIARNMRVSFNFEASAVICIVCAHCSMQHRAPVKVNNYNCLSQLITSSAKRMWFRASVLNEFVSKWHCWCFGANCPWAQYDSLHYLWFLEGPNSREESNGFQNATNHSPTNRN